MKSSSGITKIGEKPLFRKAKEMNNLQTIIAGTVVSVTLIESILLNIKLKKALAEKESKQEVTVNHINRPKGFIDYKTGRRVDIDPETKKEFFVD